jgi:tRNA threonylcarbamoyladenosine biosynthesis protein TsaB
MLTLALDTATAWGRFALAEEGRLLADLPHNVTGSYADALLPLIGRLLEQGERRLEEVGAVGVTCGPGSFTGVRIGLATAKGLAWALGARLVPVPTLAAMAAALLDEWTDRDFAVPALDARRGEVFAALYRRRGAWVEAVEPPAARSPDAWWACLSSRLPGGAASVWGGSGVELLVGQGPSLRPGLAARGEPEPRAWSAAHPDTARALALAMGDPTAQLPAVHPFAAVPLYLRASEAEVKRRLDLTPGAPDWTCEASGGAPGETAPLPPDEATR